MDLSFDLGSFNDTTLKVAAISDAGREFLGQVFGSACIGVELPKSRGEDFMVFATRKGMRF